MDHGTRFGHGGDGARPLAVAHRAGNDLGQLARAEAAGVDYVEADVWLHRGRLEVRHCRTLGPIPILWDCWELASARGRRLQLPDVLAAAARGTVLLLDLKGRDRRLPGAVVEALRRHRPGAPALVCSQRWDFLDALRGRPEVGLVYSVGTPRQLRVVWPRLAGLALPAVSVSERLLDRDAVRTFKGRAVTVLTWPVNDAGRRDELLAWGVDGVISDDLQLLRAARAAGGRVATGPLPAVATS